MGRKVSGKKQESEAEPHLHDHTSDKAVTLQPFHGPLRVSLTAYLLGIALGLGVGILLAAWHAASWWLALVGTFLVGVATLHQGEYVVISFFCKPSVNRPLSDEGFLVSHNVDYAIALIACWLEFFARSLAFPNWRIYFTFFIAGIGLMVLGQVARLFAILTLREVFSVPATELRRPLPPLCTNGIYRRVRHPAGFGFWCWGIGTQLVLHNPLCLTAFSLCYWWHLRNTIQVEEKFLASSQGYGEQYEAYRRRVGSGIPFIR